ncbi:MAG TPA: hypothetical protein VIJ71_00890 [Mycobacteriales bacterium]
MLLPAMPWRLFVGSCIAGVLGGAAFGFVRGLDYLPTLPFAVVEGGFLIGIPAAVLGLILVGLWSLGGAARRQAGPLATSGVGFACLAGEIGGGALAVIAAVVLPWARYRLDASPTVSLDAGKLTLVLAAVGTAGAVLAAAQLRWRAAALATAEVVVGGVMLVLSVVMAGDRIAQANALLATSGGSTAFGAGAPLSVLAALLLLAAAVVLLIEASPERRASGDGPPSG